MTKKELLAEIKTMKSEMQNMIEREPENTELHRDLLGLDKLMERAKRLDESDEEAIEQFASDYDISYSELCY